MSAGREVKRHALTVAADLRARLSRLHEHMGVRQPSRWALHGLTYDELVQLRALALKALGCPMHADIDVAAADVAALTRLAANASPICEVFDPAHLTAGELELLGRLEQRAAPEARR